MKISEQFYEYAYIFLADQNAVGSIAEESEYQRLIERAGQRVPALWESCYRNGTGRLLDKYTLAVQRAYKKSGVKIVRSDQANEPADYIGYECLFLSFGVLFWRKKQVPKILLMLERWQERYCCGFLRNICFCFRKI